MTGSVPVLRGALKGKAPSLEVERALWDGGAEVVVGLDEVGRGAWAGPLTVGAAVLPADRRVYKVRDSKMLTEDEREAMFDRVAEWCRAWAVGQASPRECDELGMSDAQRLAARRALDALGLAPDAVLVDGNWDFVGGAPQHRAGRRHLPVDRGGVDPRQGDPRPHHAGRGGALPRLLVRVEQGLPGPRHRAALQWLGPSAIHRRSWVFMDALVWPGVARFERPGFQRTLFPGTVGQGWVEVAEG